MNWALYTKDSKILSNKWNDPRPSVRSNWLCCSHGGFGTDWVTRESEREKRRKRLREKERELYVSVTGIWHSFSSLSLSFSFLFGNQKQILSPEIYASFSNKLIALTICLPTLLYMNLKKIVFNPNWFLTFLTLVV